MTVECTVIEHYRHGALEDALLKGLAAAGKDVNNLTPDDLAPADEFHIGGRQATIDFAAEFKPSADTHWLDIGSGLGGKVSYRQASALALPFENNTFDGAYMQHVGMNIADKAKLFGEVHRVLKP